MGKCTNIVAVILAMLCVGVPALAQGRRPPYWASINRSEAIMRRGPSSDMRAMWEYRRIGLPLRIIAVRGDWRHVQDPDGVTGWMHRRLLTGQRTAIVTDGPQPIYESARSDAAVSYRAETGVVGRLGECRNGFCEIDVRGRSGWISADGIWGDGA